MSRIGFISDTHDNLDRVRRAVALFNDLSVEQVIHCGDVIAQFVLTELVKIRAPLTIVFGNCDGDKEALTKKAKELGFKTSEAPLRVEVDGKSLIVTHKPVENIPECDFYIHGHTHRIRYETGRPIIVNPGEACGWLTGKGSVAVINTKSTEVKFFEL